MLVTVPFLSITEEIPTMIVIAELTGYVTIDEAQSIADYGCAQFELDPETDQREFQYRLSGVVGNMIDDAASPASDIFAGLGGEGAALGQLIFFTGLLISQACPWNMPAADQSDPIPMEDQGLLVAQELADALASEDWPTVRRISPTNPYSDAELTAGYAGLDDSTLVLASTESIDSDTVVLYLMQVAHETRPEGRQTSVYCNRWDYHPNTQTIEQTAGELLSQRDGVIPAADSLRGAFNCAHFDTAG